MSTPQVNLLEQYRTYYICFEEGACYVSITSSKVLFLVLISCSSSSNVCYVKFEIQV
uniref:Uncharacterized protein n=1 Tax=Arundo donax TaxID=35708 RepID=A0A0A9B1I9_ARUDO